MSPLRFSVAIIAVSMLATACSGGASTTSDAANESTTTTAPTPAPVVTSTISDGASDVRINKPMGIQVENGVLENVELSVVDSSVIDETEVPAQGILSSEKTGWLSPSLAPHTNYEVVAEVVDLDDRSRKQRWSFGTGAPVTELHTTTNVGDDRTYGVGMPIIITLNEPVDEAKHDAIVERLDVTSSTDVEGAWRWFSDSELHWRPKDYWPAHTEVSLDVDFNGFSAGGGVWGVDGRTVDFKIGDAQIAVVDAKSHQMVVRSNGEVIRKIRVSTGKDSTPTRSGVHVVNEKSEEVTMDSATVGIPEGSPDYYKIETLWNVRISNSGEFIHAAPWSVGSQGHANVSNGCVNLSPQEAEWYYHFTRTGDVVEVINTPEQHQVWNGWGDWQMSWSEWIS